MKKKKKKPETSLSMPTISRFSNLHVSILVGQVNPGRMQKFMKSCEVATSRPHPAWPKTDWLMRNSG